MTTINTKLIDSIIDQIKEMDSNKLIELNNLFCQSAHYFDDEVFENDEYFFDTYFHNRPFEVARSTFYGDYNFSHDFVRFDGYGNLKSFQYFDVNDLPELIQNIAEYISENKNDFLNIINFDEL